MKKELLSLASLILVFFMVLGCSVANVSENDTAVSSLGAEQAVGASYYGAGNDVMLQGFHWSSWQFGTWNIIKNNAANIKSGGFTMVWFPPASKSTGGTGYLPTELNNLSSAHGTSTQLTDALNALNGQGVKAIADIVINHRCGTANWADFTNPAFADNKRAVTKDDEWGQGTGAYDTGSGYDSGRDLDHTYSSVQSTLTTWMNMLKNIKNASGTVVGFKGWRYDYVKGYAGSYNGTYNTSTAPYFSVGELWPDITGDYYASGSGVDYHRQKIMDWINATGGKSTAFDFTTKWQLMLAFDRSEYWRLKDTAGKPIGAIGWWPQMSVTFIDNHDTGPSPTAGQNHWPFPSAHVEAGYAYILTHPGTPCVYWPHYFDWGTTLQSNIKKMVSLRKEKGITSTSSVSIMAADASKYAAIINGNLAMKVGPGAWSPGTGWTFRASGTNWSIWTK